MRKRRKNVLRVRGLRTPRILLWTRGFVHGKILHSGGLDAETEQLASGYISGQTARFRHACTVCEKKVELRLAQAWREADQILLTLSALSYPQDDLASASPVANSAQARQREAQRNHRAANASQRLITLKRLSDIANTIQLEMNQTHDQMEATAQLLLSAFSAYGHGMLMRPVCTRNLPVLRYEDCADRLLATHEDTWKDVCTVLKEEKKDESL